MRRHLVLTDETARHPFLASLPPHIRRAGRYASPSRKSIVASSRRDDVRQFLMAYCACFLAVATFVF